MKTIIAATDFSGAAENALNYAADLAANLNFDLDIVHVFSLPVSYATLPVPLDEEGMFEAIKSKLDNVKDLLVQRTNGTIRITSDLRTGAFFQQLKEVCDEIRPFAVVMGCQGTTAAERFFFGSHAIHAMKHLSSPLITVPSGISYAPIKRIGLACDLAGDAHAIPHHEIESLVKLFGAELHILNTGKMDQFRPEVVAGAGIIEDIFKELEPNVHFITGDSIDTSLLEFAEKNQIDMLIIIPLGHDFIDRLIHRSHTRQFVLQTRLPLMAVHPRK